MAATDGLMGMTYAIEQIIDDCFEGSKLHCCRFNHAGTMLATGCMDGRCIVWDLDTRGVIRALKGHSDVITHVR